MELSYVLVDLPSTFHRAGAAGLKLLSDHLGHPQCSITEEGGVLKVTLEKEGLQALLASGFRTREACFAGSKKASTVFEPCTLMDDLDRTPEKVWGGLWAKTLDKIRKGPGAKFDPVKKADELWKGLQPDPKGKPRKVNVVTTLRPDCASSTAIGVSMREDVTTAFLLYFWVFAMHCFVPFRNTRKGLRADLGFLFAVPDVADVNAYCEWFRSFLQRQSEGGEVHSYFKYYPREAMVATPVETIIRLAAASKLSDQGAETDEFVIGYDVYQVRSGGKTPSYSFCEYLSPSLLWSETSETGRTPEGERVHKFRVADHSNPELRKCMVLNAVYNRPWYQGLEPVLVSLDMSREWDRRDIRDMSASISHLPDSATLDTMRRIFYAHAADKLNKIGVVKAVWYENLDKEIRNLTYRFKNRPPKDVFASLGPVKTRVTEDELKQVFSALLDPKRARTMSLFALQLVGATRPTRPAEDNPAVAAE